MKEVRVDADLKVFDVQLVSIFY